MFYIVVFYNFKIIMGDNNYAGRSQSLFESKSQSQEQTSWKPLLSMVMNKA